MMRLRQVALVAADLEQAEQAFAPPLGLSPCHRDPGLIEFGLHNVLYSVGDCFIEIVSPLEDGTTAGRLLDKRSGDGGYMVLFQVEDLTETSQHLQELGTRIVYVAHGEGITGLHLHPKDMPGAIVSLDEADVAASWPWAGSSWTQQSLGSVASDLVGVTIQVEDPKQAAATWATVLRREVTVDPDGVQTVTVDDGAIRFVPMTDGRGPGVAGIDLAASERSRAGETLSLGGITIRLV